MDLKYTRTGGPYGDATTSYKVNIKGLTSESLTLEDFINLVLTTNKDEWGNFRIRSVNGQLVRRFPMIYVSYRDGEITEVKDEEFNFFDYEIDIDDITANGGWSSMDYTLSIKSKNSQNTQYTLI